MVELKDLNQCAIIIQARMSSSRFFGKMMSSLWNNMPLIEYVYKRCKMSSVKNILVATSVDKTDDALYDYCKKKGIPVTRGSLDNVLERCTQAADSIGAGYIVRVCGDTPFVDISWIDKLLIMLIEEKLDYVSFNRQTCASAFYSESVTLQALKKALILTRNNEDFQHVTKYIIDNRKKFSTRFIDADLNPEFMDGLRLTIDYPEDIQRAGAIVALLQDKFVFTSNEVLNIVNNKLDNRQMQ